MLEKPSRPVRCRFAPSPTGSLHLGGARTALFNYLFAKHCGGTYILRIEDTDHERSTPEAVQTILDGLRWLGLQEDEGPYYQSARQELHLKAAQKLLASGNAYRCYCTAEELQEMREHARSAGLKKSYNGKYRPKEKTPQPTDLPTADQKSPFVIRLRVPEVGDTVFNDVILDEIRTANEELDDFIIVRSDGTPTYNFVVVVDDIDMGITHVIRGMDHISNTPKQVLIYTALNEPLPIFAHVPMILGEDKKKLSKRHGATSVFEYKKAGFLPEAFINYLARLGWSHGDQEIFSLEELIKYFSLESIGKGPAVFDFSKLEWVSGEHIRQKSYVALLPHLIELMPDQANELVDLKKNDSFVLLFNQLKERSRTLNDLIAACHWFLFNDETLPLEENAVAKLLKAEIKTPLESFAAKISNMSTCSEEAVEAAFNETLSTYTLSFGKLGQPVRLALTGQPMGPPIHTVVAALGAARASKRLLRAAALAK